MQVGGSAVDVVLAERRAPGHVVRVEDVRLLAGLAGQPLLGEALVLHQQRVVGVLAALWLRQRVLGEQEKKTIKDIHSVTVFSTLLLYNQFSEIMTLNALPSLCVQEISDDVLNQYEEIKCLIKSIFNV